ncbi:MAG: ATP-binding protein [Anaerolineae bacterium]|nr:ATP-binding protein [Anaerolineae bacterium]
MRTHALRSISFRLALAFLFVGLLGAALVSLYVGLRTRTEFDRFIAEQEHGPLADALADYYEERESWEGIGPMLRQRRGAQMSGVADLAALVDARGTVIYGGARHPVGATLSPRELQTGTPLIADDNIVGYLLYTGGDRHHQPGTPEAAFLGRIRAAIVLSAISAAAAALVVGGLLARTLMNPIRALTDATQAIARGELGRQVEVRNRDELGDLAAAFNQMSRDLDHTTQLRRQMMADIAHDLRTPLSVLMGYTEALTDGKLRGSPETFSVMHQEARHLDHLINDLRLLSLADAGELALNRVPTSPAVLLQQAEGAYRIEANSRGVALRVEVDGDLPQVSVDQDRMAQIFGNLLTNAIRHTPEGGSIILRARQGRGRVVFSVEDTGTGIAEADLPYVFERFYRGDPARQQNADESGLGLAIVKSLVEAHGGTVAIASAPGSGTTFTIDLFAIVSAS